VQELGLQRLQRLQRSGPAKLLKHGGFSRKQIKRNENGLKCWQNRSTFLLAENVLKHVIRCYKKQQIGPKSL
jgi:hypothetical protein